MATTTRIDTQLIGGMLESLLKDFEVAQETSSLREWAEAVEALSEYMAERHKEFHTE